MSINKFSFSPNFPKTLNLLLGFLLLFFTFSGCDCCKRKPLVEIVSRIQAPTGISFIDVNGATLQNVANVHMTIVDEQNLVMSANGVLIKEAFLTDGVMSVGLSPEARFSLENPYRFFVRAEAPGYMTVIRPVVITQDLPNFVPIYMAKLNNLPTGLAAVEDRLQEIVGNTVTREQTLNAPVLSGLPKLNIRIPKNTTLLCDGKPIRGEGPLTYRILMGRPRDSVANRVFPGGFEVTAAMRGREMVATPAEPFFFTTAGWFSMEMNVGEEGVNGFSQPLEVEMPIDPKVLDPNTGEPVQLGQKIPVWSLDNRTGIWNQEGEINVETTTGGDLVGRFKMSHLSDWNLDFFTGGCPMPAGDITITYPASISGLRFAEYIRTTDNAVMKTTSSLNFTGAVHLNRVPTPSAANPYFLMVRNTTSNTSPIAALSGQVTACGQTTNLTTRPVTATCVNLAFVYLVGNAESALCSNALWHRASCSGLWDFAGTLDNLGMVQVPRIPGTGALGNQCLQLKFSMPSSTDTRTLLFTVNFGAATPQTGISGNYETYNNLGAAVPGGNGTFSFDYEVSATGACGTTIKITVDPAVVTALVVPCT